MASPPTPFSLYIHIPYCAVKCPYCDFNVRVARSMPEAEYAAALISELEHYARMEAWMGRELKSVFFGGGTPSLFKPATIAGILDRAARLFPLAPDVEITLEANPENRVHFQGYREAGVNRLSLGAQSFQPQLLEFLGRLHSADETRAALGAVRAAGFDNFSLDLIYAVPGQTLADLQADLTEALDFSPPHLSAYNLTIVEGTPFHHRLKAGKIQPLPEDEEIAMAELIEDTLTRAGLERYEISNYARPGFRSRHNSTYWQGGDYLGIGAGAHSFLRCEENGVSSRRWRGEKNPTRYMERVRREGAAVAESESLDRAKAASEFMFMGLRMTEGVAVGDFFRLFGRQPAEIYVGIDRLTEAGLMAQQDGRLRLTRRGLMIADEIFTSFI